MIEGVKSPTVNKFLQKAAIYIDEQGGDASIITGSNQGEELFSVSDTFSWSPVHVANFVPVVTSDYLFVPGKKENEKGTSVIFKADHPFLFLLTTELSNEVASYTNDLVLLMGKVTTPETIL